jgi:hypothetical protein
MSTAHKKTVIVHAPDNMTLEQAQKSLAAILTKVGHPGCYSGFNINFVNLGDPAPLVLNVEQGGGIRTN